MKEPTVIWKVCHGGQIGSDLVVGRQNGFQREGSQVE